MSIYTPFSMHHSKLMEAGHLISAQLPKLLPTVLSSALLALPPLGMVARAQTAGDVVVIGDTSEQQTALRDYWNQLMGLSTPPTTAPEDTGLAPTVDPQQLEQALLRRVRVGTPELRPIIGLSGSSQVRGSVTNGNDQPITVAAINYEIVDSSGNLIQTGSAVPQPATIAPGQTVTFTQDLLATSVFGKRVRLAKPAVVLQGGI